MLTFILSTKSTFNGVTLDARDFKICVWVFSKQLCKKHLELIRPTNNSALQAFKANGGTHASLYAMVAQWAAPNWGPIEPNEWGENVGVSSSPMLTAYAHYNYNGNP